jgi:hypothetical protein
MFCAPDSFSAVRRAASGPVFLFSAPGLVFGGTEGVGSCFHVLRSRTHFLRYRRRLAPFSCFARPDAFSALPRASGLVLLFCAPGLIFDGTESVRSFFHVLLARTHFRRGQVRRAPFSCFARTFSFSTVPRAWGPVFMFCMPGLVFGGTEDVGSHFIVLRSQTRFRWCRVRRVLFSCLSARSSFRRYRGRGSRFHVLCARTRFRRY